MFKQKLADELSDLRTQIMRLQRRESLLQKQIADAEAQPGLRPGWPIRRLGDQQSALH
jgi:hypothetical protein